MTEVKFSLFPTLDLDSFETSRYSKFVNIQHLILSFDDSLGDGSFLIDANSQTHIFVAVKKDNLKIEEFVKQNLHRYLVDMGSFYIIHEDTFLDENFYKLLIKNMSKIQFYLLSEYSFGKNDLPYIPFARRVYASGSLPKNFFETSNKSKHIFIMKMLNLQSNGYNRFANELIFIDNLGSVDKLKKIKGISGKTDPNSIAFMYEFSNFFVTPESMYKADPISVGELKKRNIAYHYISPASLIASKKGSKFPFEKISFEFNELYVANKTIDKYKMARINESLLLNNGNIYELFIYNFDRANLQSTPRGIFVPYYDGIGQCVLAILDIYDKTEFLKLFKKSIDEKQYAKEIGNFQIYEGDSFFKEKFLKYSLDRHFNLYRISASSKEELGRIFTSVVTTCYSMLTPLQMDYQRIWDYQNNIGLVELDKKIETKESLKELRKKSLEYWNLMIENLVEAGDKHTEYTIPILTAKKLPKSKPEYVIDMKSEIDKNPGNLVLQDSTFVRNFTSIEEACIKNDEEWCKYIRDRKGQNVIVLPSIAPQSKKIIRQTPRWISNRKDGLLFTEDMGTVSERTEFEYIDPKYMDDRELLAFMKSKPVFFDENKFKSMSRDQKEDQVRKYLQSMKS